MSKDRLSTDVRKIEAQVNALIDQYQTHVARGYPEMNARGHVESGPIRAYIRVGMVKFPNKRELIQALTLGSINIDEEHQRKGLASSVVERLVQTGLRRGYPLHVEQVLFDWAINQVSTPSALHVLLRGRMDMVEVPGIDASQFYMARVL